MTVHHRWVSRQSAYIEYPHPPAAVVVAPPVAPVWQTVLAGLSNEELYKKCEHFNKWIEQFQQLHSCISPRNWGISFVTFII